jgi:hypothetical protein
VRLRLTGTFIYFEAMPPRDIGGTASKNETAIGKAEPFPTEGGRAAAKCRTSLKGKIRSQPSSNFSKLRVVTILRNSSVDYLRLVIVAVMAPAWADIRERF